MFAFSGVKSHFQVNFLVLATAILRAQESHAWTGFSQINHVNFCFSLKKGFFSNFKMLDWRYDIQHHDIQIKSKHKERVTEHNDTQHKHRTPFCWIKFVKISFLVAALGRTKFINVIITNLVTLCCATHVTPIFSITTPLSVVFLCSEVSLCDVSLCWVSWSHWIFA